MRELPKIVITGGPGGGKTTALDLYQREFKSRVKVVPEAATILFGAGLGRFTDPEQVRHTQKAIFDLQKTLESAFEYLYLDALQICDRGRLDGLAFWPEDEQSFFDSMGSTYEEELARYDAVIFFESSAKEGEDVKSNNPYRIEGAQRAIELDKRLRSVWEKHPNFHFVPNNSSFMKKIAFGILTINSVLEKYGFE